MLINLRRAGEAPAIQKLLLKFHLGGSFILCLQTVFFEGTELDWFYADVCHVSAVSLRRESFYLQSIVGLENIKFVCVWRGEVAPHHAVEVRVGRFKNSLVLRKLVLLDVKIVLNECILAWVLSLDILHVSLHG